MHELRFHADRPGLLVSVRNVEEARVALAAGTDVIDVKEPARGALGAADWHVVAGVVESVAGRVPVSVARGELTETDGSEFVAAGVAYAKLGLAGCGSVANWQRSWWDAIATWPKQVKPVAVVYADWQLADAPPPKQVVHEALRLGLTAVLVDTWDKSGGNLFDHWRVADVKEFCGQVRTAGCAIVLAGSLNSENLDLAVRCSPDLVAVRGAACEGGRAGSVSAERIRTVRRALRAKAAVAAERVLSP